jgi:hypothetical protein
MTTPPTIAATADPPVDKALRWFFLLVAALTGYVLFWGFFFPGGLPVKLPGFAASFDDALPFNIAIPPLHARFIGSFYGAATVVLIWLALKARRWSDLRLCLWMVFLWTGVLGLLSFLHLEIFDWARPPFVAWFLAYIGFPLYAGWRLWANRRLPGLAPDGSVGPPLRAAFWTLGVLLLPLSVALFLMPGPMTAAWPWKLPPILAQVYSGPFLAFAVGGLLAARAGTWREVRGYVYVTLLFAAGTLIASAVHRALFDPARPVTWLWFGGFTLTILALVAAGVWPNRGRREPA